LVPVSKVVSYTDNALLRARKWSSLVESVQ
jgi:hypothetical protein